MANNNDDQDDPLKDELTRYIAGHLDRITINLVRVGILVAAADEVYPTDGKEVAVYKQDIIRSAVVFLHATLEDFLRYIGSMYLPTSREDVLNRVPIVGSPDVLRAEKFFLGRLASHRGKSVDQLISDSIAAYLDRLTFNDTNDISALLEAVDIEIDPVRGLYPQLANLMRRRHQIVHRGDLLESDTDGPREAAPIAAQAVMEWHDAVKNFISTVITLKIEKDFIPRLTKRRSAPDEPA